MDSRCYYVLLDIHLYVEQNIIENSREVSHGNEFFAFVG